MKTKQTARGNEYQARQQTVTAALWRLRYLASFPNPDREAAKALCADLTAWRDLAGARHRTAGVSGTGALLDTVLTPDQPVAPAAPVKAEPKRRPGVSVATLVGYARLLGETPNVTLAEAAEALGVSTTTIGRIRQALKADDDEQP